MKASGAIVARWVVPDTSGMSSISTVKGRGVIVNFIVSGWVEGDFNVARLVHKLANIGVRSASEMSVGGEGARVSGWVSGLGRGRNYDQPLEMDLRSFRGL